MTQASLVLAPALAIGLGLIIDRLIGDPEFGWHPVRLIGRLAGRLEGILRPRWATRRSGLACWLAVVFLGSGPAFMLSALAWRWLPPLAILLDGFLVWMSIAPTDLARQAGAVAKALRADRAAGREQPETARLALARIVGREVDRLDYSGCAAAAVESVAESSIDGVAAPLFWAALAGAPAAFAYRAANTLDSMFGHKDATYRRFGWASARLDDLANFLPARLSSLLAAGLAPLTGGSASRALRVLKADRLKHASPNSGHPEAVYAGAFNLRLGGPCRYREGWIEKPWLNHAGRPAAEDDIGRAIRLMWLQSIVSALGFLGLRAAIISLLLALA